MGSEKRRHSRITHQDSVTFVAGARTYSGSSLNISRSGMQVVVNVPESHESIRSIKFSLPHSKEALHIPCRLVRVCSNEGEAGQELGIEFLFQAEAQMLLIEKFIREMKRRRLAEAELRQLPRAACVIRNVKIDQPEARILSIDNISIDGILVSFEGDLKPDQEISLEFLLPGDSRPLRVAATVVYIVENAFSQDSSAGVRLRNLRDTEAARIRNYIVNSAAGSALRAMNEWLESGSPGAEYQIRQPEEVLALLRYLVQEASPIHCLIGNSLDITCLHIRSADTERNILRVELEEGIPPAGTARIKALLCSFYLKGGNYFFQSQMHSAGVDSCFIAVPPVIYRSEKRSYKRKVMEAGVRVTLFPDTSSKEEASFTGKLIDISRHGFLCEIPLSPSSREMFQQGRLLLYELEQSLGLDAHGEIRHLKQIPAGDGGLKLRIGVEAGIRRKPFRQREIALEEWSPKETPRAAPIGSPSLRLSKAVRYRNIRGQEICALINATGDDIKAPVVVLPPAFGKKKEALLPLVCTLLANFSAHNRHLVTLRYDGINCPGESYNAARGAARGYEMLHYRTSQGVEDLRTTLDFVYDNPYFQPERVILVSFSLSALEARRLLSAQVSRRIDAWISCMGLPAAQSTLANLLAGCDIISNYRMKVPNGICGLLGHILDMDTVAQDLLDNRMAYLTDGRVEMSRIPVPVLWIYGTYDRWISSEEVRDLMSVHSEGEREVVEIPTGHNLRTSEEAIKTFKLISAYCYERLQGERIEPFDPDGEEMLRLIEYERERLASGEAFDAEGYWRGYLIGNGKHSSGYDFFKNLDDFDQFLRLEARLISPEEGDRIADMGCGTGLLLDVLLKNMAQRSEKLRNISITAVDLVQEALDKAQARCRELQRSHPSLRELRVEYIRKNLEPNRLLPVKMFVENRELDFSFLRNKVHGLRNTTLDLLTEMRRPELLEIMRGDDPQRYDLRGLQSILYDGHLSAVLDFNRAARFLQGRLEPEDFVFEVLNFGDQNLDPQAGFADESFTKIIASLFLSYIHNPELMLHEFHRILGPGGTVIVSTMKPDCDISMIFTEYVKSIRDRRSCRNLRAAREMLNEVSKLFSLEEEGFFRFFSAGELSSMLAQTGFERIRTYSSLGNPPQAIIAVASKP